MDASVPPKVVTGTSKPLVSTRKGLGLTSVTFTGVAREEMLPSLLLEWPATVSFGDDLKLCAGRRYYGDNAFNPIASGGGERVIFQQGEGAIGV